MIMRHLWIAATAALVLVLVPALGQPAKATEIIRVISPGGIEAWLVQEPSIPMLSVEFVWEGGARLDPPDKTGLANMVSGLLDEGAGDLDSTAFQTRLEDLAIRLSFNAGKDTFGGSLRTLSKHRRAAFEMLALAIAEPRFDPEPVERIRGQILTGIAQDEVNPRAMVSRGWFSAAFPEHGYGRPTDGEADTVKAIKTGDLKRFVAERLARDNLVIGVVGDITPRALARLVDSTFGHLTVRAKVKARRRADVWPIAGKRLSVIEYDGPQSVVMFGMRGLKRDDPDYYAAYVMNYILGGGGLTSRLNGEVREKRGLTYSIYSYLHPMAETGLYLGGLSSSNDTVAEAISLTRIELQRMRDHGISERELADAKTYLNGSFPLRLSSNAQIAGILIAMQRHELGIDYLEQRADYIDAVTVTDVRRVARRLLRPEQLRVVVVGKPAGLSQGG